ncbi:hypothetical protein AB0K60_11670, partial [Thermopolyspora sp. NPDC052614]
MRGRTPLVLRRAVAEPLLLLAAFGSILLATTTLVALTAYAASVADVGVRRVVAAASQHDTAARVTAPVSSAGLAATDRSIQERLSRAYGGAPVTVMASARSDSYALPGGSAGSADADRPDLTRFAFYQRLDEQARLLAGDWPRSTGNEADQGAGGDRDGSADEGEGNATGKATDGRKGDRPDAAASDRPRPAGNETDQGKGDDRDGPADEGEGNATGKTTDGRAGDRPDAAAGDRPRPAGNETDQGKGDDRDGPADEGEGNATG